MIEQPGRDIFAYPAEAGRPAQHADGVIVAVAIDIGTGLDQQADHLEVGMRGGEVQGAGIVGKVTLVDVGAARDQQAGRAVLIAQRCNGKGRGLFHAASAERVDQLRVGIEPFGKGGDIAGLRGDHDGLHLVLLGLRVEAPALDTLREDLDVGVTQLLGDLVDRAAVAIRRRRIKTLLERAAHRLDVAVACGGKDARAPAGHAIDVVDVRLQRAPAGKAMVSGDGKLRLMQLGIGRMRAQFDKPLLGGLLQPVEIGIRGQCLRHGTPSFKAPGDRITGRKKGKSASSAEKAG